jgi:DNA polymerase III delta prime subunit
MSIAFKEGLKIPPPAVNEIILAANQDMRQVITVIQGNILHIVLLLL